MLVLNRTVGEKVLIGDSIVVSIVRIQGDKVRIGIEAPSDISVHREEIHQRILAALTRVEAQVEAERAETPIEPALA